MTTDYRIDRLERQLRSLRVALFLAIAAFTGAVVLGLAAPGSQAEGVVSTSRFLLMSEYGERVMGSWTETPAGMASLSFYNTELGNAVEIVLDNAAHGSAAFGETDGAPLLV